MMRILKDAKRLRELLMTMVLSLPSLVNVVSLLLLVVYMYALVGVQLFTYVRHQSYLNDYRNFDSFGNAVLLLFQCLTGDGWSYVMNDAMISPESHRGCSLRAGDCGGWWAIPYFVSFQVLGSFVMLNILVAVILENFTSLGASARCLHHDYPHHRGRLLPIAPLAGAHPLTACTLSPPWQAISMPIWSR